MMTTKDYDEVYSFGEVSDLKYRGTEIVRYYNKRGDICHRREIDGEDRKEFSFIYDNDKIIKKIETKPIVNAFGVIHDTLAITLYTYNNGKEMKRIKMKPIIDNHKVAYDTLSIISYTYDTAGRQKFIDVYEKKSLTERTRYEYTTTGYKEYVYNGNSKLIREIEKKGKEYTIRVDGINIISYFDDQERIIQQSTIIGATNGRFANNSYFTYNKYGDCICHSLRFGAAIRQPQKQVVYTRLPNGNIVSSLGNKYSNESHGSDLVYRYEYDQKSNWTIKSDIDKKRRTIREIIYAKTDNDFASINEKIESDIKTLDSALYQKKGAELRRKLEEERRIQERKKRYKRYEQMVDQNIERQHTVTTSLIKMLDEVTNIWRSKELLHSYEEKYPYICKVCGYFKYALYIREKPHFEMDCTIKEYENRLRTYIEIQKIIIQSLDNPINKKEIKSLERSLKKEDSSVKRQSVILKEWLANRGCKPTMISESGIINTYKTNNKKLIDKRDSSDNGKIATAAYAYISSWSNLPYVSRERLLEFMLIQEFAFDLIKDDDALKEEKDKLLHTFNDIESLIPTNQKKQKRDYLLAIALEECMKNRGITIPDEKDIDKMKF